MSEPSAWEVEHAELSQRGLVRWHFSMYEHDGTEHPQKVILRHFPDATAWDPRAILDCWYFYAAPRDDPPPGFKQSSPHFVSVKP